MRIIEFAVGDSGSLRVAEAAGPWSRFWGLMGRKGMPHTVEGVFFPRCSSIHTVGMRFPLDVVFLRQGVVTRVARGVRPYRFVAGGRGVDALEVAAGTADLLGLAPGVRVSAGARRAGAPSLPPARERA